MVFKKSEIGFHFKHLKSNICRQHKGEWTGTTSYNLLWFAFSNANANNLPNLWSNRCPEQVGELCEIFHVIWLWLFPLWDEDSSFILSECMYKMPKLLKSKRLENMHTHIYTHISWVIQMFCVIFGNGVSCNISVSKY